MEDVLPYFQSCLERTSEAAAAPHANCGGSWTHPRDTHGAELTKRARRVVPVTKDTEHPHTAAVSAGTRGRSTPRLRSGQAADEVQRLFDVLRRWGIKTLGALAALPAGDVYERLGARGVLWQRLARGEDQGPLVPCVPDDPFEGTLDLEWPIEGLEPLSFVLARLFEPLAERLERADRGAAILHTHLRLTTREVHARTVQLPAPMRDPKTLRTLVLLDLESNPPSAAIDRVRVLIEPTQAKVLQWTLYERAQASPEQVSTLLARLTALMGDGHVGSAQLVNSWKPGAFEMTAFAAATPAHHAAPCAPAHRTARDAPCEPPHRTAPDAPCGPGAPDAPGTALRRFRLPIPARVHMQEGRPVRVMIDRRGVTGGAVAQWAGPWRTSGEWWNDAPTSQPCEAWDRDEWDVVLDVGPAYRIFVERSVGQWFIDGVID
jgi:protein ImuB